MRWRSQNREGEGAKARLAALRLKTHLLKWMERLIESGVTWRLGVIAFLLWVLFEMTFSLVLGCSCLALWSVGVRVLTVHVVERVLSMD